MADPTEHEYLGDPADIRSMKRGAAMWSLLRDDPRYAYYGRIVGQAQPQDDVIARSVALARLQGVTVCYRLPKEQAEALAAAVAVEGLGFDRHEHYRGGAEAHEASRDLLSREQLPKDLTVETVSDGTPQEVLLQAVALWRDCGVAPVPVSRLTGQAAPGICRLARDGQGDVVGAAVSLVLHHPESPQATDVFWGMLAVREDRRGQRIAALLGAQAIVHMWETHGARGFMTGVRHDNASSQALCHRLGVRDTPWCYAVTMDPEVLGRAVFTK